ncbi:hypothetical protein [Carnobacterium divergens]|uniref:Uncharacterized protein n=1 Tax=Carnobacterium divergens DSM 20623 TaxID=1449336 RepID=A0A0R2I4T7_CARDV|nr:hypothetical protein [Carnobacterium divergens]KRN56746.1 hypothetical protein IV74_GL000747 [Carnobacterium divergens DSM 20623]MDO0875860.1 hypothetical protein [Carnobacterium divergens]SUX15225.1 Uncharacterised protein [Carnobacterium divergens]
MNKKLSHKVDECLSSISLKEANKYINFEDIDLVMNEKKDQKFSIGIKKLLILILALFFPIFMELVFIQEITETNDSFFPKLVVILLELLIICLITYQFLKQYNNFLRNWGYKKYCYISAKLAYISYFIVGFGMNMGDYRITFVVVTFCIVVLLFLYYKVEQNMILEEINEAFNRNYKTSKVMNIMLKVSGVVAVLILIGMQVYRLNKWWLNGIVDGNPTIQNSLVDNLIGIFIGIPLLLLISLIPTYFLFNVKHHVQGKVISQYSEQFREQYNYTKKEWYGD